MIELPKADRRYKSGNIAKDSKGRYRGNPDTVTLRRMTIPEVAPMYMQLNPPLIVTPELAEFIKEQPNDPA